jgi:hypothetical protein
MNLELQNTLFARYLSRRIRSEIMAIEIQTARTLLTAMRFKR